MRWYSTLHLYFCQRWYWGQGSTNYSILPSRMGEDGVSWENTENMENMDSVNALKSINLEVFSISLHWEVGEPLLKNKRNIKRKLKGAHMRALCRGLAKTPSPHRGLYSNHNLASCKHLWFIDCFLTPITPTVGRSHGNAPSIKEALLHLHSQWKSCELIQYDCWDHMNMGVLLYYICH